MRLTAAKMSRAALASANSGKRIPGEGRGDVGVLVGCTMVGVAMVGVASVGIASVGVARVGVASVGVTSVGVGVGRVGVGGIGVDRVGVARVGVGVSTRKGTSSCESGKGESRDDFELHIVLFFCCDAEH